MRVPIQRSILLLAATMAACGQSLPANMTGTGGVAGGGAGGRLGMAGTGGSVAGGTGGGAAGTGGLAAGGTGGGAAGTGGLAAGGTGGGSISSTCAALASQYNSAINDTPGPYSCEVGASGQCLQLVPEELAQNDCFISTYVNDTSALAPILQAWQDDGCAKLANCGPLPPAIQHDCLGVPDSTGYCGFTSTGGIVGTGSFGGSGGTTGIGGSASGGA